MASKESDVSKDEAKCPVCLEASPVITVGTTCNHVFCRGCLEAHLRHFEGTFPCPTCQVEYPLPPGGVDGLMVEGTEACGGTSDVACGGDSQVGDEQCEICQYTVETFVAADHLCVECGKICLCENCTISHRRNEGTKHHNVIPLKPKKPSAKRECSKHRRQWITHQCCDCSSPVCGICIHIGHGEHRLKNYDEVFRDKVELVKSKKEREEKRLKDLKGKEGELKALDQFSKRREDAMLEAVEEHAEEWITQIIEQKQALKAQVKVAFKPIHGVQEFVGKIPAFTKQMSELVVTVDKVVAGAEPCPSDVEKLSSLSKQLDETAEFIDKGQLAQGDNIEQYENLLQRLPTFVPTVPNCKIGSMVTSTEQSNFPWGIKEHKVVFKKDLPVKEAGEYIPSVCALANRHYAVAHPTTGGPSDAIDIYRYPGILVQTLREGVSPVIDTAATPEGNLAVLTEGTAANTCCVKLYHPVSGYLRSTADLDIQNCLSFDVNLRHQYVILNMKAGVRKVNVFNENGSLDMSDAIVTDECGLKSYASRIACSMRHIYITGKTGFGIYKIGDKIDGGLDFVMARDGQWGIADISTNCFNHMVALYKQHTSKWIVTYHFNNGVLSHGQSLATEGPGDVGRISVQDNHIICSVGNKLKVYEWKK